MKRKNDLRQKGFTLIELMVVILIINILMALLLPSIQAMRESVRRGQCQGNLSRIVLAVKEHEEVFGLLPSGVADPQGPIRNIPEGKHLGWIALILPFLEQTPLFNEIDFLEGTYDPANRTPWLTDAHTVLMCPTDRSGASPHSNYMACHEGVETPIDAGNRGMFFLNSTLRSRDISDGNSYTIWFGECNIATPRRPTPETMNSISLGWMSGTPGTIRNTGTRLNSTGISVDWPMPFNPGGYLNTETLPYRGGEIPEQFYVGGFGSLHPGGANFALGDGQVRMLFETIDASVYRQLGRRNDQGPHSLGD